jgi:hypothetical protein
LAFGAYYLELLTGYRVEVFHTGISERRHIKEAKNLTMSPAEERRGGFIRQEQATMLPVCLHTLGLSNPRKMAHYFLSPTSTYSATTDACSFATAEQEAR